MGAQLIDGKAFAQAVRNRVGLRVRELVAETGQTPGLAVVLVGHDPASEVYVRSKGKQAVAAAWPRSSTACQPTPVPRRFLPGSTN